jgi:hypothetical protein
MVRRSFIAGLVGAIGFGKVEAAPARPAFPPVPTWHPSFQQPIDRIVDRLRYYTDRKREFVVMQNGTCVIIESGLSNSEAEAFALKTLAEILSYHPDMNPSPMDDGNILVRYNHPAVNVVLKEVAQAHWAEIEQQHLNGLTASEVLMTPLGPNKFDAFGKQALLGRAYMFMDAQQPAVVRLERNS